MIYIKQLKKNIYCVFVKKADFIPNVVGKEFVFVISDTLCD